MVLIQSYHSEWPKMNLTISKILVQTRFSWNMACAIHNTNKRLESWNKQTGVFCLTETVWNARGYIVTIFWSILHFVLVCSTHLVLFLLFLVIFLSYVNLYLSLFLWYRSTLGVLITLVFMIFQEMVTKRKLLLTSTPI